MSDFDDLPFGEQVKIVSQRIIDTSLARRINRLSLQKGAQVLLARKYKKLPFWKKIKVQLYPFKIIKVDPSNMVWRERNDW